MAGSDLVVSFILIDILLAFDCIANNRQVSRGGSVHPRVLEPLISLTLRYLHSLIMYASVDTTVTIYVSSPHEQDWEIAEKYIGQLVWLISYPNIRVQFQSAWGLANLATCKLLF